MKHLAHSPVLGIIPARGGSKGIPRKNIRFLAGRPLIAYSISSAQESKKITRLITSTDDQEIATLAQSYGSEILIRPNDLAADDTPMISVVKYIIETLEQDNCYFPFIVILQPTAPLRNANDIDQALEILLTTDCDSVVSVYQVGDAHPSRMYYLVEGFLSPYDIEPINRLRQSLKPVFHRNGAIYALRRELLNQDTLIGPRARPYIMPHERSVNIDEEFDFQIADLIMNKLKSLEEN